ncbi:hypothetical protein [Bacillus benzoevorans]|uniref:Uncharacterized protein n=1 Tax=Bacillus benzoevorans TaxID=1456 RepID=A0A7X0HV22_9BACI|nr:hypothetical protein [Bacillus benzoevorans]MBB6446091.1 hypothetical protein [Bacillus benzoevorans]
MKKMYLLIGGALAAIVFLTFGIVSWNEKIETTSESAKEKIEIVKKSDPDLTGDAPLGSGDAGTSTNAQAGGSDSNTADDGMLGQGKSGNPGTKNGSGESPSSPVAAPNQPGTALADIKSAYRAAFSDLEVWEGSKIDQIVVQAKADYVSGKYLKEDLLVKYQEIALSLEDQADQSFNAIYQQLEADLQKNGHDPNEAVSFRNEYQQKKAERQSHVISELSEF